MAFTLAVTVIAVGAAAWSLLDLYKDQKQATMRTVRECAENAALLEIIGRMKPGAEARESFIRLNSFIEMAQQKDGLPANSDTLRTSLAVILKFGLEFRDGKAKPDPHQLDSLFRMELARRGLFPRSAFIIPAGSHQIIKGAYWVTDYRASPSAEPAYRIFVSPMPGKALAGMWGIIIPFVIVICLFAFLTAYLSRTVSRMKTLEQMKDDFTRNMTHELKTPVAAAYAAADSMLRYYDQSDEARNRKFLEIILQRLNFLSGMVENILSASMERFKTLKLKVEEVKLKPLAEEVSEMIEQKATKPVKISIDIPDRLTVRADALHLGNVLTNLLDNAVKYSGDSVNIRISAGEDLISVSDDGIGISKAELPHIFDRFYRVTSGDRYEAGGYGLGLFYVKQIVELHGWSVEAASEPGKGTIFTIKFNGDEKS